MCWQKFILFSLAQKGVFMTILRRTVLGIQWSVNKCFGWSEKSLIIIYGYVTTKTVYILFRIYRPALCWQKFGLIIRVPKWLFESTWFQFHGELQKHDSPSSPNNSGYLIRSELLIDDYVDKKSFQLFIHVVQCQICWQKLWFWHFMYFYKF